MRFVKHKNGSAVLLVILVTTILSSLVFIAWHKSSLFFDLVLQKEKFYKNFYLTESFLSCGICLGKNYYNDFLHQISMDEKAIELDLSFLIARINKNANRQDDRKGSLIDDLQAKLIISKINSANKKGPVLLVSALLLEKGTQKALNKLSCVLVKTGEKESGQSLSEKQESKLMVQNFTIGNLI